MADWTEFPPSVFLPGEPITSPQGLGLFENPVALAEGATAAPRIARRAMLDDGFIAIATGATFDVIDLDPVKKLRLIGGASRISTAGNGFVNIAFSSNNGSTFETAVAIYTLPPSQVTTFALNGTLDLDTGVFLRQEISHDNSVSNAIIGAGFSSTTLTVPAGTNAVRFTSTGTNTVYSIGVFVEAGRATF